MFTRLRNLFRRSLENPSSPIGPYWGQPNSAAGVYIDEATCLTHLPVWSAVNRISSDIALLDPQLFVFTSEGKRLAADHPLTYLICCSPNGEITADRWRQAAIAHVLTWGNSYSEVEYGDGFEPVAIHLLRPDRMRVARNPAGQIVYRYQDEQSGTYDLPAWKILHFAGLAFDGLVGYSPIALCRETLALGKSADMFGAAFFGNAARPSGMLTSPQKLSNNAIKNLRESFSQMHAGPMNTGRTIIGEEGLTWTSLTIPPDDAQFLETRRMSVEDVARLYGIPSHKIGGAPAAGGIEEQNIDYLQTTLLGLCNMLEGELTLKLLSGKADRGRFKISHDFKKLLQANAAARAAYNSTAIQWGWATRNQVAQEEGYEPYKGGEAPLFPLNMIALDPEGKPIANPTPPAPATPTTPSSDSSSTNAIRELTALVRHLVDAKQPTAEAKPDNSAMVAAVEAVAVAELQRAYRRESAALTRAAAKPGFRNSVETIYAEHESYLAEALAPSFAALNSVGVQIDARSFAKSWAEQSQAQLVELEEMTTSDQRPAAVADLLKTWEQARINTAWKKSGAI